MKNKQADLLRRIKNLRLIAIIFYIVLIFSIVSIYGLIKVNSELETQNEELSELFVFSAEAFYYCAEVTNQTELLQDFVIHKFKEGGE